MLIIPKRLYQVKKLMFLDESYNKLQYNCTMQCT